MDFVIPLRNNTLILSALIEALIKNYNPRTIYIVTSEIIENQDPRVKSVDEHAFFQKNYNLSKQEIQTFYTYKDDQSREFGWWYQQLIKLGAVYQINALSDPYVVWDSDLIPLKYWPIEAPDYKFAILQDKAKSEWNKEQYRLSIKEFIGLEAIEPEKGTFIPHHFVFHHCVLEKMIPLHSNWIEKIMRLSNEYYRFSEYKCVATYMDKFFPHLLNYYKFEDYGKGIRYRDCNEILDKLIEMQPINYDKIKTFAKENYETEPSYLQIEHLPPAEHLLTTNNIIDDEPIILDLHSIDDINSFLEITETDRTADYLHVLNDTNLLINKLLNDVAATKAELDEERTSKKALERELWNYRKSSCAINRIEFGHYFFAALDRQHTEEDWLLFSTMFDFSKVNKEVYKWIDENYPKKLNNIRKT